jgi:MoxR-like ATPase
VAASEKDIKWFSETFQKIVTNIEQEFIGKPVAVKHILSSIVAGGHILLEDVPGTGKTALARILSKTIGGENTRVQFTPDLLPSDITGISVYDQKNKEFVFHQGPVFANIVLADEINRASPKTQSALLEVMEEGKVTVDGITREVPSPFLVIATQNPVEQAGTYRLPEAQLDRFLMKTSIGYTDHQTSVQIIDGTLKTHSAKQVVKTDDIVKMQNIAENNYMDPSVSDYIIRLVEATRAATQVKFGSSIRGGISLAKVAKVWAASVGRNFVTPDDVKELAVVVLGHRLILEAEAEFDGITPEAVINQILLDVSVPTANK